MAFYGVKTPFRLRPRMHENRFRIAEKDGGFFHDRAFPMRRQWSILPGNRSFVTLSSMRGSATSGSLRYSLILPASPAPRMVSNPR